MADNSHHLLLVEYPEYSASMWGPMLGRRIDEDKEREKKQKKKKEQKHKLGPQVRDPVATNVQKWVGEQELQGDEHVGLTFQQQLLSAGGQAGGWKDELFDDDLLYLNRREWNAEYMNDVEWREARTEYAKFEPRTRLEPADAVRVLLPKPKAEHDHPYRNLITFADRFGHARRELPGNGKHRVDWTTEKDYCPDDSVPCKNLRGGYSRQPEWSKKAMSWATMVDRMSQPTKRSMRACQPDNQESSSAKVTVEETEARDVILKENFAIQNETTVSSTPPEGSKVTLVTGRKRRVTVNEASLSSLPMPKKRRLSSALGEVNC